MLVDDRRTLERCSTEIAALLDPPTGAERRRCRVERTLTDGYAHALDARGASARGSSGGSRELAASSARRRRERARALDARRGASTRCDDALERAARGARAALRRHSRAVRGSR